MSTDNCTIDYFQIWVLLCILEQLPPNFFFAPSFEFFVYAPVIAVYFWCHWQPLRSVYQTASTNILLTKKQLRFYSSKKYTQNAVNCRKTEQIICKWQNFRIFKESKVHILPNIKVLADSGYRGIRKIHESCHIEK